MSFFRCMRSQHENFCTFAMSSVAVQRKNWSFAQIASQYQNALIRNKTQKCVAEKWCV